MNKYYVMFVFLGVFALTYYLSGFVATGFERGIFWGIMHLSGVYFILKSADNREDTSHE